MLVILEVEDEVAGGALEVEDEALEICDEVAEGVFEVRVALLVTLPRMEDNPEETRT